MFGICLFAWLHFEFDVGSLPFSRRLPFPTILPLSGEKAAGAGQASASKRIITRMCGAMFLDMPRDELRKNTRCVVDPTSPKWLVMV